MKKKRDIGKSVRESILVLLTLTLVVSVAGLAAGQTNDTPSKTQARSEVGNALQPPASDALRERIHSRIEKEEGLQEQDRERLRQNLDACKELGLGEDAVATLFDESQPLGKQIRAQDRVLAMVREGLPPEPVMQKLQEGRRKGASEEAIQRACVRMEDNVRAADRLMKRAHEDGITPGTPDAERERTREMAASMWRGLNEAEGNELRECARLRLRDGSCTTEDLTASAEAATKLEEMGIERHRAITVAGDALQHGYTARDMRQLCWMVMTARTHGGPSDEVMAMLERGIRNQYHIDDMMQEMWQCGWMGPADEHGHHGMDDATGGGPGGHHRDDGHHGGPGGHMGGGGGGSAGDDRGGVSRGGQ